MTLKTVGDREKVEWEEGAFYRGLLRSVFRKKNKNVELIFLYKIRNYSVL